MQFLSLKNGPRSSNTHYITSKQGYLALALYKHTLLLYVRIHFLNFIFKIFQRVFDIYDQCIPLLDMGKNKPF